MADFELVTIDELLDELGRRSDHLLVVYERLTAKNEDGDGVYIRGCEWRGVDSPVHLLGMAHFGVMKVQNYIQDRVSKDALHDDTMEDA